MNLDSESETHQMEEEKSPLNQGNQLNKSLEIAKVKSGSQNLRPALMPTSSTRETKSLQLLEKRTDAISMIRQSITHDTVVKP